MCEIQSKEPHDYSYKEIIGEPKFVLFRGEKVIRGWPEQLEASQKITHLTLQDGTKVPRTLWGDHPHKWKRTNERWPCFHCCAEPDEYHELMCNYENCPNCDGQLNGCSCCFKEFPEEEDDELDDELLCQRESILNEITKKS